MDACKQVQEYEGMVDQPIAARFEKFRLMQDKFIKQGSNFEINIETKMRNAMMKVGVRVSGPRGETHRVALSRRRSHLDQFFDVQA